MNSSSNKYCSLKKSFNYALKIKCIPIPFLIEKNSHTTFKPVPQLERSSIFPYVTDKRSYQIVPLNKDRFFITPPFKDRKITLTTPSLFEKRFWQTSVSACKPLAGVLHVSRSLKKSPRFVVCANKNCTSVPALKKGFGINLSANSLHRLSTESPPQLSYSALYTFQRAKLNTCSLNLNSLAQLDQLNYSCCNRNTIKKNCMIVRPLLDLSRGIITAICKYGKLPVYPDQSNQSLHYSRNRIRKQIIPSIQLFFNPQAEDALFKFTELVLHERDLVSRVIHTTKR